MRVLKITVVGPSESGKSAFIRKLTHGQYLDTYTPTIGGFFTTFKINEELSAEFWDLTGSERFEEVAPQFVRGSDIVIFCGDLAEEFDFVKYSRLRGENAPGAPIYFINTKRDRELTQEQEKKKNTSLIWIDVLAANPANNFNYAGDASAKEDSKDTLTTMFCDRVINPYLESHPASKEALCKEFHVTHAQLKTEAAATFSFFRPAFISRSHITPTSSLHDILLVALHSETNVARKACIKLRWIDEAGALLADAPVAVKSAFDEANKKKMTTNFLGWETVTLKANG